MGNKKLQNLEKELQHIKKSNNNAPFPVFDTEHVEHVEAVIKELKIDKEYYDGLPVEACGSCGNLALKSLDEGDFSIVCLRCNSINDIVEYKNNEAWENSKHGKFWKNL